ncbi:MAG: DUF2085 domain-containing protein [Lachnospiraceae bacterium]|nr:DUF2085 domain-containing protein [Lachnospiraceae bacterium]
MTSRKDRIWMKLMEAGARTGCHQMASRSFSFKGYQFPLCARCTGVLAGELGGIALILAGYRMPRSLMASFVGIMGVDWWLQHARILESTNIRRLITGSLCGAGLTYAYFYAIRGVYGLIAGDGDKT